MGQDDGIPGGDSEDPRMKRIRDPQGAKSAAWERTLENMEAIAEDRREDGWEVLTVMAAHTDAVSIDMRDHDEFGLTHIVPDNHAEPFEEMYDPEEFTEYFAYGREVEQLMFLVTELIDSDTERSILIAGQYDTRFLGGLVESARRRGVLYTRVKTIDGTTLGVFEHENWKPLVATG